MKISTLITFLKKDRYSRKRRMLHDNLEIEQREIVEEVDEIRTRPLLFLDLRDVELSF